MAIEISGNLLKNGTETSLVRRQKNYHFSSALRPFSLFIAIATTGIVCARLQGHPDYSSLLALLVIIGTVLAQAAVNLFNDWSEREAFPKQSANYRNIKRNCQIACIGFCIAATIGFYIAVNRGAPIVWLALTGFIACLTYTLEPVNLKRRGLGLPAVFLVMGPVLMMGSSYAVTGAWQIEVLTDSLIFSPLISLVLLANELRDFEHDYSTTDKTFTVRVGFSAAGRLFLVLIVLTIVAYSSVIILEHLRPSPVFLIPLALALWIIRFFVSVKKEDLAKLPPLCGRLVLATGAAHIIALLEF